MPDRSWLFILFFVFQFLTALFSYALSYLQGLSDTKLEKDRDLGNKRAGKLLRLTDEKEHAEGSLQTGTVLFTALSFLSLGYSYSSLPERISEGLSVSAGIGILLAALLLCVCGGLFSLLLGYLIPQKLGSAHADSTVSYGGGKLLLFCAALFRPVALLFGWISRGILRLFGIDSAKAEGRVTEDEILDMVDMGEESGNIESGEKEMIENIFDFTDITAADVMTHRTAVTAIDVTESDAEIFRLIGETGYSRFPVYEEDIDNVVGILNAKTYLLNRATGSHKPLRSLLYPPYLVPESVHADKLLSDMKKSQNHLAVVLDEYGGTLGIVTMEDLLEEIVGNIYDETDRPAEEQEIIPLGENLWRVAGSVTLETLTEELDLPPMQEEDCDTLGGLVFSRLTVIPEDGSTPVIDAGGLHIEAEPLKGRRVEWAKVSVLPEANTSEEEND